MKRIKEVIVVEGRHDTDKLKKYFDCDTIETGGTSLGKEVLERIKYAQEKRGVIIFTDPDSPGNRIRNAINREIPGCKNAFIPRKDALTPKKVGVEHAKKAPIEEALSNLVTYDLNPTKTITMSDMVNLGLCGGTESAKLREKVGIAFHLGNGNAKTMLQRLNCLGITVEELKEVIQ